MEFRGTSNGSSEREHSCSFLPCQPTTANTHSSSSKQDVGRAPHEHPNDQGFLQLKGCLRFNTSLQSKPIFCAQGYDCHFGQATSNPYTLLSLLEKGWQIGSEKRFSCICGPTFNSCFMFKSRTVQSCAQNGSRQTWAYLHKAGASSAICSSTQHKAQECLGPLTASKKKNQKYTQQPRLLHLSNTI